MSSLPAASATSDARRLAFSEEDVLAFAEASGDRNPVHIDARFARRTPFGGPIVHGSLLTLGALGCLPDEVLSRVRGLEVSFGGAVRLGEPVTAEPRYNRQVNAWEVRLSGRGKSLVRVVAREAPIPGPGSWAATTTSLRPMRSEPFAPDASEGPAGGEGVAGAYESGPALAEIARHRNAGAIDPVLVEALGWASYVVGMELPGLHGLFAAAKLSALGRATGGDAAGHYSLRIRERDSRTEWLLLDGVLVTRRGETAAAVLECFTRPELPELNVAALLPGIPRPASGRSVVVIGAGRGFGAAATLALLGQGHEAHAVSSTAGEALDEARLLAGTHADRLILHRADAGNPGDLAPLLAALADRGLPLHGIVLAAAPPPVPMGLTAESASSLGDYVAASVRLAAVPLGALLHLVEAGGFVLFCSSSAVTAPPPEWPHYVAAKGALEGLAGWTAAAAPGVRTVVARLPKLLTAMTNSPGMRVGAVAPEAIARRLVDRLESGELQAGLTMLGPEAL